MEFNGLTYLDPGADDAEALERFRSRGSTRAEIGDMHEDGHMIGGPVKHAKIYQGLKVRVPCKSVVWERLPRPSGNVDVVLSNHSTCLILSPTIRML